MLEPAVHAARNSMATVSRDAEANSREHCIFVGMFAPIRDSHWYQNYTTVLAVVLTIRSNMSAQRWCRKQARPKINNLGIMPTTIVAAAATK